MQYRFILVASILTLVLIGCRPRSVTDTATAGDFVISLWVSTYCAQRGETMTARATITNRSAETQIVESQDQPVFDLIFGDEKGEHRWSDSKPLTSDLTRIGLEPNESKNIEVQWTATYSAYVTARFINPHDSRSPFKLSVYVHVDNCPGALP